SPPVARRRPPTPAPCPSATLFRSDQQVAALGHGLFDFDVDQRVVAVEGAGLPVTDGFHGATPVCLEERMRAEYRQPSSVTTHKIGQKSTRLNSSHVKISYAVFCLK